MGELATDSGNLDVEKTAEAPVPSAKGDEKDKKPAPNRILRYAEV